MKNVMVIIQGLIGMPNNSQHGVPHEEETDGSESFDFPLWFNMSKHIE